MWNLYSFFGLKNLACNCAKTVAQHAVILRIQGCAQITMEVQVSACRC